MNVMVERMIPKENRSKVCKISRDEYQLNERNYDGQEFFGKKKRLL
jgi:hypothetical protein